ncbi:MAG: hypothetical protein PHQ27_00155 [Victivallales bacterium]|nr:hypothetical protein [Victivallales bacterium]
MKLMITWHRGIVSWMALFLRHPGVETDYSRTERWIGLALSPLRGLVNAALVLVPFLFLITSVRNLDPVYTQVLFPLMFCLIIEKATHWRRIDAFCRCTEAVCHPERAARIMSTRDAVVPSPQGMCITFFLLAAKLLVLYMMIAKFLVGGIKTDAELLCDFGLLVAAVTMLAETGSVLLLCGDEACGNDVGGNMTTVGSGTPPMSFRAWLPLAAAVILTLPVVMLLWTRLSPQAVIMPAALVLLTVFLWKHKADRTIGRISLPVAWACYESSELAAMIGLLIV